ncbi:galactose transporter [Trichomonascus vanleenenianus]|uniref:sugar porter family MFS transporter n=1 Tax=Trichomonascus vanleenenianus TaxID=2268995 RepID=UPI003EC9B3A9
MEKSEIEIVPRAVDDDDVSLEKVRDVRPKYEPTGTILTALVTSVCSIGFFLFGYDNGVMSGVIISKFWLSQMDNPSTVIISTITSIYAVGGAFGAIACSVFGEAVGRKKTLIFGAVVLIVGGVLQSAAYGRAQMLIGRIITGGGIGIITSVTPVYQAEISPAAHRGWMLCCQLTTMLVGLMIAYWINYGLYFYQSSLQWRFPLAFQIIFAVYIVVVTSFLPDTPRWYLSHDKAHDRGIRVLAQYRGVSVDDASVRAEALEILEALEIEKHEEGSWMDLFRDNGISGHKRLALAVGIQFMQQMSGVCIITYYAPTLFIQIGFDDHTSELIGALLQVWYVFVSLVTWYIIDRIGRRRLLIWNAIGMCLLLVAEAVCVAINNPTSRIAAVVWVFLFEACFTWGWMACVWTYPPEILPLKIRSKGAALATAADYLGNFLVVEVVPPGLENIGYKTYIIFAVFNLVNSVIVFFFYPETARHTLEYIDKIFIPQPDEELIVPWYSKFCYQPVNRSRCAVPAGEHPDL